jgi:hypothetical protein
MRKWIIIGNRGTTDEIIGNDKRPMTYSELFSHPVSHPVNCRWMKKPEGGVWSHYFDSRLGSWGPQNAL